MDLRNLVPDGGRFLRAFPPCRGSSYDFQRRSREHAPVTRKNRRRSTFGRSPDTFGHRFRSDEKWTSKDRESKKRIQRGEIAKRESWLTRERERAARSVDRRANRFLSPRDEPSFQEGTAPRSIEDPFEISRDADPRGKRDGEAHVDHDEVNMYQLRRRLERHWLATITISRLWLSLLSSSSSSSAARVLLLPAGNPNLLFVTTVDRSTWVYNTRLAPLSAPERESVAGSSALVFPCPFLL